MTPASKALVALLLGWFAGRAEAVPITYEFIQTGASHPALSVSASLTFADGTFDLPTMTCPGHLGGWNFGPAVNCTDPLDFGNLLDLTIHVEREADEYPFHFSTTLTLRPSPGSYYLRIPKDLNEYTSDASGWCIDCPTVGPFAAGFYLIYQSPSTLDLFALSSTTVYLDTEYLTFCPGIPSRPGGGRCFGTGYWAPQAQPIPEPATATLVFTGIALLGRRFARRRRSER